MDEKKTPPAGAGSASQGLARVLSDRDRAADFTDYLTMRGAEKLRAAGGTPAQRERWSQYKALWLTVRPDAAGVWR